MLELREPLYALLPPPRLLLLARSLEDKEELGCRFPAAPVDALGLR